MPLGGYCETCGRWVWVNGYGECQFGHPASVVRDVQQLKPAEQGSQELAPIDRALTYAVARRQRRWWWRHSLWIFWTFTLGFLNWLAFFYIGVRARRIEWIVSGFAYLIPVILTVGFFGTSLFWVFFSIQLAVSAISVLHALLLRPQYRALMFGEGAAGTLPAPPLMLPKGDRPALPKGIDEGAAEIIRAAEAKIDDILAAGEQINEGAVRDKVGRLCTTAERIVAELRAEPRRVELARGFLTYYLEAAQKIVTGYVDLAARGVGSAEVRSTLERAAASLDSVQQAFDRELANLVQNEVIDLDSEIALLEKTVEMENLFNEPGPATGSRDGKGTS
jgi:hypothetical protein